MKKNIIFTLLILTIALVSFIMTNKGTSNTAVIELTLENGEKYTEEILLDKDNIYTFENNSLPIIIEVENGKVFFVNSQCPDHLCEGFGHINKEGQYAVCAPAKAYLYIK